MQCYKKQSHKSNIIIMEIRCDRGRNLCVMRMEFAASGTSVKHKVCSKIWRVSELIPKKHKIVVGKSTYGLE